MDRTSICLILCCVVCMGLLCGCLDDFSDLTGIDHKDSIDEQTVSQTNISLACWNLQIFGQTKAANDTLLSYYADHIDDYDICIIQEIRDKAGTAIEKLADKLPDYSYILSQRAGQSSSKEQYALFYHSNISVMGTYDYTNEYQSVMQRPPLKVTFQIMNWSVSVFTIHTDPDEVTEELSVLEGIIGNPSEDTIIIGDLNADGSYYDEEDRAHFINWVWVINNSVDTTVAASDNTYDRIIFNDFTSNNFQHIGIMDSVNKDQSDHYLVYAVFNPQIP